jgi:copper chaperone CopZ
VSHCIALVSDSGKEIVIYDVNGELQSFSYIHGGGDGNIRDLCFSSHGHDADDLLTPCFDDVGRHGEPEEGCFCGIDTPHIHAHIHDPKICGGNGGGNRSSIHSKSNKDTEQDLMRLASLTLHPTKKRIIPSSFIDAFDRDIPKECSITNCSTIQSQQGSSTIKMSHEDSSDFLIHDCQKQELSLQRPCKGCGGFQFHAFFGLVAKRRWNSGKKVQLDVYDPNKLQVVGMEPEHRGCSSQNFCSKPSMAADTCSKSNKSTNEEEIDFSKGGVCSSKSFQTEIPLMDEADSITCCSDESDCSKPCCASGVCSNPRKRRAIPRNVDCKGAVETSVRSTFTCSAICCASEIPEINIILQPLNGIFQVRINLPLQHVIVDHDSRVISAQDIETILNNNSFGATIERDGGLPMNGVVGRSRLYVERICCASEIPAIKSIVEPMTGIAGVMINVTTKMVRKFHTQYRSAAALLLLHSNQLLFVSPPTLSRCTLITTAHS